MRKGGKWGEKAGFVVFFRPIYSGAKNTTIDSAEVNDRPE
jgi:hypothetical protein